MRQIITIQIGASGNQFGSKFQEQLRQEHYIDSDQPIGFHQVYFRDKISRTILVDVESPAIDKIRLQNQHFDPNNYITSTSPSMGLFPQAYYHPVICDLLSEQIRKEIEKCDSVQGIQTFHSISGGWGSGLGAKIVSHCCDDFPEINKMNVSLFPSLNSEPNVLFPYNSLLGLCHLNWNSNLSIYFDNDSLSYITQNKLQIDQSFDEYNQIIAEAIAGITLPIRFKSDPSSNFLKQATNLIPFPRLHCFTLSIAPLIQQRNHRIEQVCFDLYDKRNQLFNFDLGRGRFFTQLIIFKGNANRYQIQKELEGSRINQNIQFQNWIEDPVFIEQVNNCEQFNNKFQQIQDKQQYNQEKQKNTQDIQAYSINHTTGFAIQLNRLEELFNILFRRKAYLYLYYQEGMDEMEIREALSNCGDVVNEYLNYNDIYDSTDE